MSLSDKRIIVDEATQIDAEIVFYLQKDVKQAIQKLKEAIKNAKQVGISPTLKIIDEVFGSKLCEVKE